MKKSMSQGKADEWMERFKEKEKSVTDDGSSRKPPTVNTKGVFRPRQTRQLPRAVDLKGRLLSCQSY